MITLDEKEVRELLNDAHALKKERQNCIWKNFISYEGH